MTGLIYWQLYNLIQTKSGLYQDKMSVYIKDKMSVIKPISVLYQG